METTILGLYRQPCAPRRPRMDPTLTLEALACLMPGHDRSHRGAAGKP